jgi:hypothetical protein
LAIAQVATSPHEQFGTTEVPIQAKKSWACNFELTELPVAEKLPTYYRSGDWPKVQDVLEKIQKRCSAPDKESASYSFIFVSGLSPEDGQFRYSRAVLRPEASPYTTRLIGPRVIDAHLSIGTSKVQTITGYGAKPLPNPIFGALAKALNQVASPLLGAVVSPTATLAILPGEPPPAIAVMFYELDLGCDDPGEMAKCMHRAEITLKDEPCGKEAPKGISATYMLAPLQHLGIGAGVAAIVSEDLNTRAKVEGDVDPATDEVLTFIALNWHPWGFDDSWLTPTFAERFRLFIGPTLTPNIGICAGAGFAFFRGFAVQAGYGVLIANVLRAKPTLDNPTFRGPLGVFFAGFEFSL